MPKLEYSILRVETARPAAAPRPPVTTRSAGAPRLRPRPGWLNDLTRMSVESARVDRIEEAIAAAVPESPKVMVETHSLTPEQAHDARRDPAAKVSVVMPVRLVAPFRKGEAGAASVAKAKQAGADWGVAAVGADASLKAGLDGAGVKVAVLDSGIDPDHPAFAGVTLTRRNFGAGSDDDVDGHGTHCAGTIFGREVDGVRIGVAPGVTEALIGKVFDDDGGGSTKAILDALQWAKAGGAQVVSMSLGIDFPGMQKRLQGEGWPETVATSIALRAFHDNLQLFDEMMDVLHLEVGDDSGMVLVAASGNESLRDEDPDFVLSASLPASANANVVSVGACASVGGKLDVAPFSNVNPILCAPGVDVVSARPTAQGGGLVAMDGTSMACPHVAGVAALWWQWLERNDGGTRASDVRARLRAEASVAGFAPGVTRVLRGAGCARAPSRAPEA